MPLPTPGVISSTWGADLNAYILDVEAKADNGVIYADASREVAATYTDTEVAAEAVARDAAIAGITGVAPAEHTHPQSDVTNLVANLAAKAALVHTHAEADVTNLVTDLAGKAATVHTHAQADTTGLVTALGLKAATVHTHAIADVTLLQAELDSLNLVKANAQYFVPAFVRNFGDTAVPGGFTGLLFTKTA